jgi:eukaryotic-like serine/threonine-protein kinase
VSSSDLTGALVAAKYELLRLIGRGGMGAVYEARNVSTLRRCAVKLLLSPELAGDGEVVKRFFREAKASGLIESEHVVAAFDSGIDEAGRVFYVMECLNGVDLEQALERVKKLDPIVAAKLVFQAASGLASAHAHGVVHRDVKPANLFLAEMPTGEIKLKILDFGVAKVKMKVFDESGSSLTQSGSLLGTPLYMSPAQLKRAASIDESADVWSLGVVLFECVTGHLPWGECDGIGELVTAILTLPVPPLQDLAPWAPPELAEVVERALSRDPARQFRSAEQMLEALRPLVGPTPRLLVGEITGPDEQQRRSHPPRHSLASTVMIGPTPVSGTPAVTNQPPKGSRLSARLAAPLGGLALALVTWITFKEKPPERAFAAVAPTDSAPPHRSPTPLPSASAAPSAVTVQKYSLEVSPPRAQLTVDRVPVPVRDGRASIEGPVDSVRLVRVTFGGRSFEGGIALTRDGLVPSRIALPDVPSVPRMQVVQSPPSGSKHAQLEQAVETNGARPSASPGDLSEVFE